jgi:hypothetical protein
MERSHFLAKLIGPVFIVGGVGMLFNTAVYRVMFERALHDHMLIYLSGILALVMGLAMSPCITIGNGTGRSSSPSSAGWL